MRVIEANVRRDTIDQTVVAARSRDHDPARWALPLIAEADARCGQQWSLVELDLAEVADLWLPAHAGEPCHGDNAPLAGGAGGRAGICAQWLAESAVAYARSNPTCWQRITAARDSTWGPIVVAPFSVGDRHAPAEQPLVVIDGLHRVLGWSLRDGHEPLRAFLAGPAHGSCRAGCSR